MKDEQDEHRITSYKSLFWMLFTICFASAMGSRLYVNQINSDHESAIYLLQYKIDRLEAENTQLLKVQKDCFDERQQSRRGSAVENKW
jgi:hypothetical protein